MEQTSPLSWRNERYRRRSSPITAAAPDCPDKSDHILPLAWPQAYEAAKEHHDGGSPEDQEDDHHQN
ncbi:hypothetical protein [Microlunatus endophyticus]